MPSSPTLAAPDAPPASSGRLRRLAVLLTGWTLRWFGVSFYAPYLLLYLHNDLGLNFVLGGLVIGGVALLAPPLSLMGGGLTDRFGRRRLIVTSLAAEGGALGVLSVGVLHDLLPVVLAGMVLSQVCSSVGVPSTIAYVGDSTDAATRTRAIAWVRIGINLGYSGGIAVGGVLLLFLAFWEMTAIAALVVTVGAAVGFLFLTPSSWDRRLESGTGSTHGAPTSTLSAVGQSLRRSARTVREHPVLLQLGLACGLSYLMFQQLNYSISTFGLENLGISYGLVGTALAVNGVTCVVLPVFLPGWLAGRPLTRVGAVGAAVIGVGLFALGVDGGLRLATIPFYVAAVFTMSVGECFATLPPYTLALNLAPTEERGAFSGAISMSTGLIASTSAIFAGVALSAGPNPWIIWGILSAPALPSIAVFGHLGSRIAPGPNRV